MEKRGRFAMIRIFLIKKEFYKPEVIYPKFHIVYNKYGKPISKQKDRFLSISHSGEWAAIGLYHKCLGIDIQKYKQRDEKFIEYVTGDAGTSIMEFNRIWSIKESFVKWLGCGWVGIEPNEILIDFKNKHVSWHNKIACYQTRDLFENYSFSICCGSAFISKERILYGS